MRPRKRDFRGDARKGAKNYGIVSSDDSEVYRRKDPFAGWPKRSFRRVEQEAPIRTGGRNLKGCASLQSKPDEPHKSHSVERSKNKE